MRSAIMLTIVMVMGLAQSSWAFRMYGPGGQFMNSSDPVPPTQSSPAQSYSSKKPKTQVQKLYEEHKKAQERGKEEEASVDMTGVRWSQSRGVYSGTRNMPQSEKLGFRAGRYALDYHYNGDRYFGLWMYSRRNGRDLLVNRVGGTRKRVEMRLDYDDEIWFEVETPRGNWEITFERVGD